MRFLSLSLAAALSLSPAAVLAAGGGGAAGAEQPKPVPGFDVANLDKACKPCDDFNKYANGGWIAANPVPAEYPTWGTFNRLRDQSLNDLRSILDDAVKMTDAPKGSNEQKIGDFYYSVLDTKTRDAEGLKPLAPWLSRIDAVKDVQSLQETLAYLHTYNIDAAFGVGAAPDFKNASMNVAFAGQGGLGLPDRDYYTKDDEKSKSIREAYVKHVARMFELAGADAAKAAEHAKVVMAIETRLANASLTNVELRDPSKSYNMLDAAGRKQLSKNLDWERYFTNVGLPAIDKANIAHPVFFAELDKMLVEVPVDQWRTYLRWRVIDNLSGALTTDIETQAFEFGGRTLSGTKEQAPMWKRAVRAVNGNLGDPLGQVYVKRYFPPESKRRMTELVNNLKLALRDDLNKLDWMSDETRKQALAKLEIFAARIGYTDKWKDFSRLEVDRGAYAANAMRSRYFAFVTDIEKVNKPVDKSEWSYGPQTVNASYNPFTNTITFPAGILQPPFFNPTADDAINYGAIGAVIGHEMTHGFDDSGSQFDSAGNLRNWWTEDDLAKFKSRAKCIESQYDAFTIGDGTHLKGKLVNGEAIADLGGLKVAWLAYQKSLEGKPKPADVDGFTHEQRFFLGYAQVWAANHTPQFELLQTNTDEHALPRFRLNGTLANFPEFHKAFNCKAGDPMVRADLCTIW